MNFLVAVALSLGVHAGLLAVWSDKAQPYLHRSSTVSEPLQASLMIAPAQEEKRVEAESDRIENPAAGSFADSAKARPTLSIMEDVEHVPVSASIPPSSTPEKTPATMAAPPAPTAEEWQLASTYTLKNSKRYRHNWGQLVRSRMGTAVEGLQQGLVRFRIEIAPDGKLAKVEVLWSTSEIAEKLALQAIRSLPPLPPTPTGKPLVFEKTIAFVPFETGWPPIYKYDCLPDPPSFHNPFAWNGTSPQRASQDHQEDAPPSRSTTAQAECPDAGPDSIEAEEKDMERQFEEWGAARLNGAD
ncbi:MAG: TonB family protein [Thiobacillus sp.]